jgi:hypothetical protein
MWAMAFGLSVGAMTPLDAQTGWRVAAPERLSTADGSPIGATLASTDSSLRISYSCPAPHGIPVFAFSAAKPFGVIGYDSTLARDVTDIEVRFGTARPIIIRGAISRTDAAKIALAPEAVSGFAVSTALAEALVSATVVRVEWSTSVDTRTARFNLPPDTRAVVNQVRGACGRTPLQPG